MPFNQFIPRPLTAGGVHTYAPVTSGVYGISNAREWIYIGESDNIQHTLLSHLQEAGTPLMKHQPTGFVFEVCNPDQRRNRHHSLVQEYGPSCNSHIPGHAQPGRPRPANI